MFIILAAGAAALAGDSPPPGAERGAPISVTGATTGDFGEKSGIPVDLVPRSVQVLDARNITRRGAPIDALQPEYGCGPPTSAVYLRDFAGRRS